MDNSYDPRISMAPPWCPGITVGWSTSTSLDIYSDGIYSSSFNETLNLPVIFPDYIILVLASRNLKLTLPGHRTHGNEIIRPGGEKPLSHTRAGFRESVWCQVTSRS